MLVRGGASSRGNHNTCVCVCRQQIQGWPGSVELVFGVCWGHPPQPSHDTTVQLHLCDWRYVPRVWWVWQRHEGAWYFLLITFLMLNCVTVLLLWRPYLFLAHENNAHCLAVAVNALAGAIFAYFGPEEQKLKMKDFLIVRGNPYHHSYPPNSPSSSPVHIFSYHDSCQGSGEGTRRPQGQRGHIYTARPGGCGQVCHVIIALFPSVRWWRSRHSLLVTNWSLASHTPFSETHTTMYTANSL